MVPSQHRLIRLSPDPFIEKCAWSGLAALRRLVTTLGATCTRRVAGLELPCGNQVLFGRPFPY